MREWSIRVFIQGEKGEELPANIFDKVTYKLHPTFANPNRGMFFLPCLSNTFAAPQGNISKFIPEKNAARKNEKGRKKELSNLGLVAGNSRQEATVFNHRAGLGGIRYGGCSPCHR